MSTIVNRVALVEALRAVRPVASGNPALPVLANVAIDSTADQLSLITTNLDQFARRYVAFDGDPLPSLTVSAKALSDFASGFSGDTISLTLDNGKLRLVSGRHKASLAVIDRDEFPAFPQLDAATSLTLSSDELATIAAFVVPFAATDLSRPILTGVSVRGEGNAIRFAAADNYRLCVVTVDHRAVVDAVIPARALALTGKVLSGGDVTITLDPRGAVFASDAGVLFTRLIDGQFPNIDTVMPTVFKSTILINRDEYAAAAKLAALVDVAAVKFEESDAGLRIYASDPDRDFDTTVDATFGPSEEKVNFSIAASYVIAMAAAFNDSTNVEIGYGGTLAPVAFTDPGNPTYRAVVMPVRTR